MDQDEMPRVVAIDPFAELWADLGLSDDDYRLMELEVIKGRRRPVVREAGGVRKMRFAPPGRGKSGGFRVFYADLGERGVILLLAVLAKGQRENLTASQRNTLAGMVRHIEDMYKRGVIT